MTIDAPELIRQRTEVPYIRGDIFVKFVKVLQKTARPLALMAEQHPEFQHIYDEVNDAIREAEKF